MPLPHEPLSFRLHELCGWSAYHMRYTWRDIIQWLTQASGSITQLRLHNGQLITVRKRK